jgi:double-stranded uracil-DNA glycosylase
MARLARPRVNSFPPLASDRSRRLILGSMPGVASLQAQRYYAHPQNLFWPFVGDALGFDPALPYVDRVMRLDDAGIAIWDVLESCERPGSLDSAIASASLRINDFNRLLADHPGIGCVLFNGASAESFFRRHVLPGLERKDLSLIGLPSTSPANASIPRATKLAAWRAALRPA